MSDDRLEPEILDERALGLLVNACLDGSVFVTTSKEGLEYCFRAFLPTLRRYNNVGGVWAFMIRKLGLLPSGVTGSLYPYFNEGNVLHKANVHQFGRLLIRQKQLIRAESNAQKGLSQ